MIAINQYQIEAVITKAKMKEVENLVYLKYKEKKFIFCLNQYILLTQKE